MIQCICPICGKCMIENNSYMWTGQRNQLLKYEQICKNVRDHTFKLSGRDHEEFLEKVEMYGIMVKRDEH